MQKMEVRNDVMEFLGMDNEGGEQIEYVVHYSISIYEHTNENPRDIQDEYYDLFNEKATFLLQVMSMGVLRNFSVLHCMINMRMTTWRIFS